MPRAAPQTDGARRGARTRERILDAAEQLFATRGYAETTLREIAAQVGIQNPSIYKHFATKAEIYEAVVERLADGDLSRPLDYRRLNGDPMSEPHGRVLTHFFNHQTHHRGQAHALVKEAGAEPPSLDYIYFTDVEG